MVYNNNKYYDSNNELYNNNETHTNYEYMSDEYLNKNIQIECNYVECKSIKYVSNHGLSIFHLNARSFVHNFDDIIMLLDSIEIKFNIIVISETWLQEYNKYLYQIENYNACHITRNNFINNTYNNNAGGGVSIFIQNHLNYNIMDNLCISKHEFVDILTISLNINNKNILISGIYKSPKADIIDFSDFIYTHFNYFSAKRDLFLVGDFNINILINNNKIKYFLDNIYSLGCYPLITKSTRYGIHINSSIDNIYCNCNYKPIVNDIIISDVSDHLPIYVVYECETTNYKKNKLKYKYIRQINDTTINNLKDSIIKHNWDYIYTDNTIDYIFNKFNVDLIRLYNDKCPIIQIKDNTKIKKPWIYSSLIKCINKKNKLYRNI